jgi:hypothetical protein
MGVREASGGRPVPLARGQWAHLKIQSLEEQLRQDRIQQLGPKSETLGNLQLAVLTEEEPSTTRDEVEAIARRQRIFDPTTTRARWNASPIRGANRCRRIYRGG